MRRRIIFTARARGRAFNFSTGFVFASEVRGLSVIFGSVSAVALASLERSRHDAESSKDERAERERYGRCRRIGERAVRKMYRGGERAVLACT